MKTIFYTLLILLISFLGLKASKSKKTTPSTITTLEAPLVVPSIASQIIAGTFVGIDPNAPLRMGNPKRAGANRTVPGKGLPKGDDALVNKQQRVAKKSRT